MAPLLCSSPVLQNRFIAATSNQLFLSLPADQAHAVVKEDGTLEVRPGHEKTATLTSPDKRFVDAVLDTVRKAEDGQFLGSDGWIREQFREYLAVRQCDSIVVVLVSERVWPGPLVWMRPRSQRV